MFFLCLKIDFYNYIFYNFRHLIFFTTKYKHFCFTHILFKMLSSPLDKHGNALQRPAVCGKYGLGGSVLDSVNMVIHKEHIFDQIPIYKSIVYSVSQSYANSFWGGVVLDTFNNSSREEDNILDLTYQRQISSYFYYDDF